MLLWKYEVPTAEFELGRRPSKGAGSWTWKRLWSLHPKRKVTRSHVRCMQHAYMRVSVCNHVTGFQNYPKRLKIAGLCVPWHLVCRWTSLPGPMATHMVSWCFMVSCKKSHLSHSFWNRRPFRFAFCWSTLEPEGSLGRGASRIQEFLVSMCSVFTLKVCDEFKGTKIGAFGFLVFSTGGCTSPSFQVKLELKHGTKNKIPLNGRKIMKDASQQQPPFRNMRTQIEQECFHQDCQMIPIILPSGDTPVRTLSPCYNLTILFAEAEKHLFSDKDGHWDAFADTTRLWNAARDGPPSPCNGFRSYTSAIGSCLVWIGSMRSFGLNYFIDVVDVVFCSWCSCK